MSYRIYGTGAIKVLSYSGRNRSDHVKRAFSSSTRNHLYLRYRIKRKIIARALFPIIRASTVEWSKMDKTSRLGHQGLSSPRRTSTVVVCRVSEISFTMPSVTLLSALSWALTPVDMRSSTIILIRSHAGPPQILNCS